ncbi:MAG: hypothetical protein Q8N78_10235, partial [Sulfurimonas sp.]|nr:hypothetical protein [Sulfurimonas sp.]
IAFADRGIENVELAREIMSIVTSDANGADTANAIVAIVPVDAALLTTTLLASITSVITNVQSIIADAPTSLANMVTYLETVATQAATSTTSIASVFTAIDSVTTSAVATPTILNNATTLATSTVTSPTTIDTAITTVTTPPSSGGGGGSSTPAATTQTVSVSADGSSDASSLASTYNFTAGTYAYTIAGFNDGDILDLPTGITPTIINTSFSDTNLTVQWAYDGDVITINLTGIPSADDGSIYGTTSFATAFGSGSIA